ncbi:hypothetical protein BJ944DRAFT_161941 [Cunninghamella echinulata]|nr:hypothetical protein BJ944DRAFT_161941 [Cunninghamella echinulata]
MKELAGKSKYSHPVHSFIMDPCDPVWKTFFTKDELDEIIKFDQMQLPALPDNWNQCIDAFKNLSSTSAIYREAIKQLNSSQKEHDEKWILHSIINILDLYTYNILSTDMSEADILNKVWGFIYKGFYHGIIDPKLGEVSSSSSSLNQNQYRSLETINPRKRKITGRKVDILFKYGSMELGCTEVGRDSAPTDDKYIDDGMKKAPIALKDMLSVMVDNDEVMKKKLSSIGVIIMGLKIQILIMDAPAGKICRLTKSDFFNFPRSVEVFYKDFKPLLQIVHILKSIMINNINTINENTTTKSVTLPSTSLKPLLIPPSFIPSDSSSPSSPTSSSPCKVSRIKTDD